MTFGEVPTQTAAGAILAHSVVALDRPHEKGLTYKIAKGTELTSAHVEDLLADEVLVVTVARLEVGDVHEDSAALRLANALVGETEGLRLSPASTGRVNVRADCAGLVALEVEAIHAVNRINPGITVATVPVWQRLEERGLVATIKIIPYAVPEADLQRAEAQARGAISYRLPQIASATLIETQVGRDVPSEKGRRAIEARLARLGVLLSERVVVPHERLAIADALAGSPGALKLVLTGSATSDVQDTAPQAVVQAGGSIVHYGMPVDPGNLLFIGRFQGEAVIGLPGCARSPALNGADWVLERLICGVDVGPQDIAAMGVGGLLKEIPSRPLPRGTIDKDESGIF